MPDRWTPETEERARRARADHHTVILNGRQQCSCGRSTSGNNEMRRHQTRAILTALADAGVLLPPGGERREEWAVRYRVVGNDNDDELRDGDLVEIPCASREAALATFDRLAEVWAHHPRLLRRVIHTGQWEEVAV